MGLEVGGTVEQAPLRVGSTVWFHGPGGDPVRAEVIAVRAGDPPRCTLGRFEANPLASISNVPVGRVEGESWWCEVGAEERGDA